MCGVVIAVVVIALLVTIFGGKKDESKQSEAFLQGVADFEGGNEGTEIVNAMAEDGEDEREVISLIEWVSRKLKNLG